MPTAYTDGVGKGEITDFTEYALLCARSFGACIMLRDEPLSSEIPEFAPSDHHQKALVRIRQKLADFEAMDESAKRALHEKEHADAVESAEKTIAANLETRRRYEAMLEKAKAYKAPTDDHQGYAAFLVSQLEESIEWDCGTEYYEKMKEKKPFEEWAKEYVAGARRSIAYHEKSHREELERTASRNKWVGALKESLQA